MSWPIRTPEWRHLCRKRNDLFGAPHSINRFLIESIRRGGSKGFRPGRRFQRVLLFPGSVRTNPRDGLPLQDSRGTGWRPTIPRCSEAGTHLSFQEDEALRLVVTLYNFFYDTQTQIANKKKPLKDVTLKKGG